MENAAVLNQWRRALVGGQRRIPDEVRPLDAEAGKRVEVRRLRDGDRHARLQRHEAVDGPVVARSRPSTPCAVGAPGPDGQSQTTDDTKT